MIHTRPLKRIPKDSAFAVFRQLPRVGHQAYIAPEGAETFDTGLDNTFFGDRQLPPNHPAARHMGVAHYDGIVLDAVMDRDSFSVTFDADCAACLASWLDEGNSWDQFSRAFPVTLRFKGLREAHVMRLVDQGAVQHLRTCFRALRDRFSDVGNLHVIEYSPSEICCVLNLRAAWGHTEYRRGTDTDKLTWCDKYYVCIRAESLTVDDRRREAWLRLLGPERLWIFDKFEKVWPIWGADRYEEFLTEIGAMA